MTVSGRHRREGRLWLRTWFRRRAEALVPAGNGVLLAVSGGADSVAMMHLWTGCAERLGHGLSVAHYDHATRPSGAADAAFVVAAAAELGLPCHVRRREGARDRSEVALRDARYGFLRATAKAVGAEQVAVAHHADDQAETVLLAVVRGAGLRGVAGMRPRRPLGAGIDLVRPLLEVRRDDLRRFLAASGLPFRDDPTNAATAAARNRVRLEHLPALRQSLNPQVDAALVRLAAHAARIHDWLAEQVEPLVGTVGGLHEESIWIDARNARKQPDLLVGELLRHLLRDAGLPAGRLTAEHHEALVAMVRRGTPDRMPLPDGLEACWSERPPRRWLLRRER